jgi:NADPH:quinone reductase-like Zn-dependent oxidoreductase
MPEAPNTIALAPGTRVLVTAGASGIGRAIADLLLAHGARAQQVGVSYAEMEKTYFDRGSLRRMVTAEDIAATVRRQYRKSLRGNPRGQGVHSRNRFRRSRLGDQLRAGGT